MVSSLSGTDVLEERRSNLREFIRSGLLQNIQRHTYLKRFSHECVICIHCEDQYVGGIHSVEERERGMGNHQSGVGVLLSLRILGVFPVPGKRLSL